MTSPKKCIATKALLFLGLLLSSALAFAQQMAGTVTHLSGPLLARKADGTVKILAQKSGVEQGDTLISEKDTYARIKFTDNSEITLRPGSQLKIDSFAFDEAQPEKDSAVFSLVKGGLRAVTGILGKRSQDKFGLTTPTATIGIRGTIFVAEYIPPAQTPVASYAQASVAAADVTFLSAGHGTRTDIPRGVAPVDFLWPVAKPLMLAQDNTGTGNGAAPESPSPGPGSMNGRAPGLYVEVINGMINLTNTGGSQNFAAGQFGYVPTFTDPPIQLPANPGMQFTPPPAFPVSAGPAGSMQSGTSHGSDVDCEVR